MTARPEILLLTHRLPYPPDKGDKIRAWRLLDHLSQSYAIHLACFIDDEQDTTYTDKVRRVCETAVFERMSPDMAKIKSIKALLSDEPLSNHYFYSRRLERAVEKMRRRSLVAEVAFSSAMAQYIQRPAGARPRIVDFCDADSDKWRRYAHESRLPMRWVYAREARAVAGIETEIANWADASFAITPEEASLFNRRPDIHRTVDWWSNGVDADYFDPARFSPAVAQSADVIFVGAMDYKANVDGVARFVQESWPLVRAALPSARFVIIGPRPARAIRALDGADGVRVTGRVKDVRPWLSAAKTVVAPLRMARGLQNKVLEAMAMAKAVVASPQAAQGIVMTDPDAICIARSPAETASAIVQLCSDEGARNRIGATARTQMLSHYDWSAQLNRFDVRLKAVIKRYNASPTSSSACASSPS
ncbi:MAG: TIGR03087 family PEP-CTERM/XrtA system glycosyltransferase [Hyphococcus sp.]